MAYFFRIPFSTSGDKTAVPEDSQPDGSVSYTDGFPPDYQAPDSDPDVKYPERDIVNDLFFEVTTALNQYQTHGFPDFISTADNDGSPYPYDQWAFVRYSGVVYYSLVGSNTALPTDDTAWAPFSSFTVPTGTVWEFDGATLPSGGWLWANGQTVGNASSNATGRANADTLALFTQIWTDFPNSIRPILTSGGIASTRGLTAVADFAANKQLPIKDKRCNVSIGRDNMGGAGTLGLITTGGCGIDGTILGASGGAQNVALSSNHNGTHTHGIGGLVIDSAGEHTHSTNINLNAGGTGSVGYANANQGTGIINTSSNGTHTHTFSGSISNSGFGDAHLNVQPSTVSNFIIKL